MTIFRYKVGTSYDYDDDSPSGMGDHATAWSWVYGYVEAPTQVVAMKKVREHEPDKLVVILGEQEDRRERR